MPAAIAAASSSAPPAAISARPRVARASLAAFSRPSRRWRCGRRLSAGSCVRIRCSSARSSGPGASPSSSLEHLAASAIHIKRVGLAPASIQREHQLPQQPLTMGVQFDESLELADQHRGERPSARSASNRSSSAARRASSKRAISRLRERLIREIGERLAAPQPQRRAQQLARGRSVAISERATRVGDQRLEALGVDLTRLHRQQVAAPARDEHLVTQRLAQMRHVPLQRLRCRRRWSLAPQLIDQTIARDHLPATQQQDRQQRPLLRAAEHNPSFPVGHLQRPQNAEGKHDL